MKRLDTAYLRVLKYAAFLWTLFNTHLHAQTGIDTLSPNSNAQLHVVSQTRNKGVLFPRMSSGQMLGIAGGSPAEGMTVFNSENNAFYYYNGMAWVRIGNACVLIEDNDKDTKVQVEKNIDEDIIRFDAQGNEIAAIDQNGIHQKIGDLSVKAGKVTINNYSLPTVDGSNKFVLTTGGAGSLVWQDPLSLPGLVAGVQTFPLGAGREYELLGNKSFLTVIIPWSSLTVSTLAICVNVGTAGAVFEVGIYDGATLVENGSATAASTGLQFLAIPLDAPYSLVAGKLYRFGVVERNNTGSSILEFPKGHSLNWNDTYLGPWPRSLKNPTSTTQSITKLIWFCAY